MFMKKFYINFWQYVLYTYWYLVWFVMFVTLFSSLYYINRYLFNKKFSFFDACLIFLTENFFFTIFVGMSSSWVVFDLNFFFKILWIYFDILLSYYWQDKVIRFVRFYGGVWLSRWSSHEKFFHLLLIYYFLIIIHFILLVSYCKNLAKWFSKIFIACDAFKLK